MAYGSLFDCQTKVLDVDGKQLVKIDFAWYPATKCLTAQLVPYSLNTS